MNSLKKFREALTDWIGEMSFQSKGLFDDGTPKMGKFETEQLYRLGKMCLEDGSFELLNLAKRPVMWRVKDYADGWILFRNEESAVHASELMGALLQGLYIRDGLSPTEKIDLESTGAPAIKWFKVEDFEPPQKTLLMVTGPSGYSTYKKFLALAYVDEDYRPSKGGPLRWQSVTDDSLSDNSWYPTHWARPVELPETQP